MEGDCGKLSPYSLSKAKEGSTCLTFGVAAGSGGEVGQESFVSYFRFFFFLSHACMLSKIFFKKFFKNTEVKIIPLQLWT